MSPAAAPVAYPCEAHSGFSQPSVENGTMPASSQTSPTSGILRTVSPQASQRIGTSSIHGLRSSSSWSSPETARSASSAFERTSVTWPHSHSIDGERQPVVTAAGDVPVAHVAQPVVHALAHVLGRPLDRRVRLEQGRADLVHRDHPIVGDAPDERRVTAPAMRVPVHVGACLEQDALLREPADDLIGGLGRREPVQPPVAVVEAARLVDGREHREIVDPAELEVLLTRAGSDVDDPGAILERDVVPRDDAVLDACGRRKVVERPPVRPPDELGSLPCAGRRCRSDSERRRPIRRSRGARTPRRD